MGDDPITDEEREIILKTRQESQHTYKVSGYPTYALYTCNYSHYQWT